MRIIIPAAGLGSRIISVSKEKPKALTPINGRPALHFILSEIKSTFDEIDVEIIIGHKGEQIIDFCEKYFPELNISFVKQDQLLGLAHAISLCEAKEEPLLVWLGDTIIQKSNKFRISTIFEKIKPKGMNEITKNSFVLYTNVKNSERWCCVKNIKKKSPLKFIEKPDSSLGYSNGLIGIYYFKKGKQIIDACREIIKDESLKINDEFQLSTAMSIYQSSDLIEAYDIDDFHLSYFDIGSIDNYHITKKRLLDKRFTNNLYSYNNNSISKESTSVTLNHQIRWFLEVPKTVKIYCPAIYKYSIDPISPKYEMEYFGFPTLQELFIWEDLHISVWDDIFNKISLYIEECLSSDVTIHQNKEKLSSSFYYFIINKTKNRVSTSPHLQEVFGNILENGCWEGTIKEMFKEHASVSLMHGDLCFSNILYDVNSGVLKVIDPRGHWETSNGETYIGTAGFNVYDLAKLMHSAVYDYDLIKNNITKRNATQEKIKDLFYRNVLSEFYISDKLEILLKAICFHLFVSMIPLHQDQPLHQKRMEDEALKIWNEITEFLI